MISTLPIHCPQATGRSILMALLLAFASSACGGDGEANSPVGQNDDGYSDDGDSDQDVLADPASEGPVGLWSASATCGELDLAYGFSLCGTRKVLGIERAQYQGNFFEWLDEGTYQVNDDTVTLSLSRIVVEPSAIRGDTNSAVLTLDFDRDTDQLVVTSAEGMPECTGLALERTDEVVDSDCELDGDGGESDEGCTADSDCGSCERCERSTGNCLTKLSC